MTIPDPEIFESLPIAILDVGRCGRVRYANANALRLMKVETVQGLPLAKLLEGPGRQVSDWLQEAFEGRGLNRTETTRTKTLVGSAFVQVSLSLHDDGVFVVLTDATEINSLKAQTIQAQKMQAIGQLAGGVAHDFNNLLTAISGSCELLLSRFEGQDDVASDLNEIRKNVDRASNLVHQLLAFSRKEPLRTTTLQIDELILDCKSLLDRLAGSEHCLQIDIEPDLPPIRSDKMQLERVLMNLLVNAKQSMADGGNILLRVKRHVLGKPLHRDNASVPAGGYVLLEVQDQGCGIRPDVLSKIFEPFFTTKETGEGTGLGLSMAYGIIKQSGGYIFANSEVGVGTTISIYLPESGRVGAVDTTSPTQSAKKQKDASEASILLVEDEDAVRKLAARSLRLRGFSVVEANCAEQALDILRDPATRFDLYLTDVIMPGMNGPDWVRIALADRPGTDVIFVSGYSDDAFANGDAAVPNSTFLAKPYSLAQLADTIRDRLAVSN